jgi:hypothetical protein
MVVHPKLHIINPHNVTHSLISRSPREHMFLVQISHLIVTIFFLISQILSLMQTTKEANPHPCIAPCGNMWSVTSLFLILFLLLMPFVGCWCMRPPHRPGRPTRGVDHTKLLKCGTLCYFKCHMLH